MHWDSCQPDLLPPLLVFYTWNYELLWTEVRWKVLTNELFPGTEQSVGFLTHSSLLLPGNQAVFVSSPHSILWRTLLNSCLFQVLESSCFGFCFNESVLVQAFFMLQLWSIIQKQVCGSKNNHPFPFCFSYLTLRTLLRIAWKNFSFLPFSTFVLR